MKIFTGIEELAAAVGTHLGHSSWLTVEQERIDTFADATGDHQWIHVDPERAAAGPFGTTIAHGYLTLSLVPLLAGEVYRVDGLSMGINYGTDKVRFPAPVPVGSRVRAGVELLALDPIPMGRLARVRVTVEIGGQDKPGCVAEVLSVLVP
ncbi:MaoC family dehydratase [Nocardioides sambongensis]|uniref:MaoC family dehydratase n=1 Tax=Nocardioides sambongensis TaxID=2589074 RepID=UPI00112D677D|nr:MaoC family dehydratase [Nocardioides sambongensis]